MTHEEKVALKLSRKKDRYEKMQNLNKQRAVTYLAYLMIIVVIVLSSCLQLIFDVENFNTARFITNLCFSFFIAIFGMILAMQDGELSNEAKKNGEYWDIKQRFKDCLTKIVDRDIFRQFCDKLFYKERDSYIDEKLASVSIFDHDYIKINENELRSLQNEPKQCVFAFDKDGKELIKPFDQINELQYMFILKYKNGHFKFPKLEYTFFTSRNKRNGYKAQAELLEKQQNTKLFGILYRCCMILIVSTILALAVINPNASSAAQVAMDMVGRIFTLITSVFFGYTLANSEMRQNIDSFEYKCDIIDQFYIEKETGSFVPMNMSEVILQKIKMIEEARKKAREEKVAENSNKEIVKQEEPKVEVIIPPKEEITEPTEDITPNELNVIKALRDANKK